MIFMKDTKKIKKLTRSALLFSALLMSTLNFSCSNFLERTDDDTLQNTAVTNSDKAYLSIKMKTKSSGNGRTIFPNDGNKVDPDDLQDFILKGTYETGEGFLLGQLPGRLGDASSDVLDAFKNNIEILPGKWTFELTANYNGAPYGATVTDKTINRGSGNSVSFVLTPQGDYGGFVLEMDLSSNSTIDKVIATLWTLSGDKKDYKVWDSTELTNAGRVIQYFYTGNDEDPSAVDPNDPYNTQNKIRVGTYLVTFDFYTGNDETPINNWESYIKISPATYSQATININFTDVYSISYNTDDGTLVSGIEINKFSNRSEFELPVYKKSDKIFLGWKVGNTDNVITSITQNTPANLSLSTGTPLTLTAYFADPTLYVSGTGDETNFGFTESEPLESIDKACEKIIQYGYSGLNWTIKINGEVTGPHTGNNNYGRSIIPETLTSDYANSITLIGNNPLDANDMPQDKINRGLNGHARDGSEEGVNLVVATSVPVTINNLLLINGNNAYPNGSSKPYVFTGGGLLVTSNATVTLGDGVVIKDNRAKIGGGVYNAGTLFIHGTAVIGDKSATHVATGYNSSSEGSNSTSGDGGAGIYNSGKLYLGYSDENTPADWDTEKGGIFYNYAYWYNGGAIYNSLSGEVFFKSGIIKYNCGQFGGGAVYNLGTFKMEGGTIENNHTGSTGGGGIYNANINGKGSGTFIMSGGSINSNTTTSNGGGIFSEGTVYLFGSAVIGKADATSAASSNTNCSNYAEGSGGGLYLTGNGKCYIGYSSFTSAKVNTIATWGGGIYYNYATNGGGIWVQSSDSIKSGLYINSGEIKNNGVTSSGLGGAIYLGGNNFSLGGSAEIPPGAGNKQDIYIFSTWSSIVLNASISTTVKPYLNLRDYSRDSRQPLLILADGLTSDEVSIATEASKFTIPDQENANLEAPIEYIIEEDGGKGYLKPKLPQATPSNNEISIDIGYNTVDLDMRPDGTYSAYSQSGSVYTLKDTSKAFKIYLYNSGNYQNYEWILEGEQISTADNIIFGGPSGLDIASWAKGNYDLTFECTRNEDNLKYSYSVQIKIQ